MEREKWETATHEAGHAVVARRLRWPVRYVTIVSGEDFSGACMVEWRPSDQDYALRRLMINIAGCAACMVHGIEDPNYGIEDDMEAARRLADMYDLDLNRAMPKVLATLQLSANKGAVAAIRSALLIEQTLKRGRIDEIMRAWPLPKSAFAQFLLRS